MIKQIFAALTLTIILSAGHVNHARAQCTATGGTSTVHDCAGAVSSSPTDELLLYQTQQFPHTRKVTLDNLFQVMGLGFVSVTEKGARCDGSTDDSAAFRAAIASLPNGGVVIVPSTGHSCVLKQGVAVSSASQSGVTLQGVGGMYWPGPYDNTESHWTAFGSWIRCDDTVNSCLTLNGNGSAVKNINFWYTQPTPPNPPCGYSCTMTHQWSPTQYPFTITVNSPQNFNTLSDIRIINAANCIDVEGNGTGVNTIYTHFEHLYLGCFNIGTKMVRIDNTLNMQDVHYNLWWYPFAPDVVGYTEGDASSPGHKIDWDMYYVSILQANDIEFYQSWAGIRVTDNSVTSGLGTVTFGAQALQLTNLAFNQVCQAVVLGGNQTHFNARMSNVLLNVDPQTSGVQGQCGQQWPYAFNLNSDNVEVSIANFDGYDAQTVFNVGGGRSGGLHLWNARTQNYSEWANNAFAIVVNAGAQLDMPGDLQAFVTTNPLGGGRVSGNPNFPLTNHGADIEGPSGSVRQLRFLNSAVTGANNAASLGRFGERVDNTNETGNNVGSNWNLDRYNDGGTFIDSPISVNRATGQVYLPDGLKLQLPTNCAGLTSGSIWNNVGALNICP